MDLPGFSVMPGRARRLGTDLEAAPVHFAELQEVYEEIGEGRPEGAAYWRPGELPDECEEVERSGLFDNVVVRHFDWEVVYDAEGYLGA
jgi:hypothetical protein